MRSDLIWAWLVQYCIVWCSYCVLAYPLQQCGIWYFFLLLDGLSIRWCQWQFSRNGSISSCPSPICICRGCRYCTNPLGRLSIFSSVFLSCHGPLVVVADDEVVQRRLGGLHLKKTWWTEESIGTASELWLQTEADGELLLPIVLSRTEGSKCK